MALPKEYIGTIVIGASSDTDDSTGQVTERYAPITLEPNVVENAFSEFRGEIQQTPPMYSAIKIKGERLYKLARQGKKIHREPRTVTIHELKLLDLREAEMDVLVRCSKGAYIRALARDIGKALNSGGYLHQLRRTKIGEYDIKNAFTIDGFIERLVN